MVYDAIGKDTFPQSLDCLPPRGLFVSFGSASGPIAAFNIGLLAQKGSLYVTRPTLFTYAANAREHRPRWRTRCSSWCSRARSSREARQQFPLREAAAAHRALESRVTTGATVLLP